MIINMHDYMVIDFNIHTHYKSDDSGDSPDHCDRDDSDNVASGVIIA